MAPPLQRFDHVHVFVRDRAAAVAWYDRVLGLKPMAEYAFWADDGGPLTVADASGAIHVALFERPPQPNRATIALGVGGEELVAWHRHLAEQLPEPPHVEDHRASVSLYFRDPDGNPYEITTYDTAPARAALLE